MNSCVLFYVSALKKKQSNGRGRPLRKRSVRWYKLVKFTHSKALFTRGIFAHNIAIKRYKDIFQPIFFFTVW